MPIALGIRMSVRSHPHVTMCTTICDQSYGAVRGHEWSIGLNSPACSTFSHGLCRACKKSCKKIIYVPVRYIYDSQSPTGPGIKLLNSVFAHVRLDLRVVPGPSGLAEP